jgi:hypothetical protein
VYLRCRNLLLLLPLLLFVTYFMLFFSCLLTFLSDPCRLLWVAQRWTWKCQVSTRNFWRHILFSSSNAWNNESQKSGHVAAYFVRNLCSCQVCLSNLFVSSTCWHCTIQQIEGAYQVITWFCAGCHCLWWRGLIAGCHRISTS